MKNRKKIDELLQYLADLQRQNPNHIFTEREVYYHLVRQDVPAEERSYPVNRFLMISFKILKTTRI